MATLEFSSDAAKQHFAKVVAHAIEKDTYFGERGLHERLEYLRKYGDKGEQYQRTEEGMIQWKILLGIGYSVSEINIVWQYRKWDRSQAGSVDDRWSAWDTSMVGGLIGHSDGTWGTHT